MMKRFILSLIFIFFLGILIAYSFKWYWLKHQPVYMQHPILPEFIESVIRKADRFVCFTVGIVWYEAIELKTGKKYLVNIDNEGIWVRLKDPHYANALWTKLSNEEYMDRFNNNEEIAINILSEMNKGNFEKGWMFKRR